MERGDSVKDEKTVRVVKHDSEAYDIIDNRGVILDGCTGDLRTAIDKAKAMRNVEKIEYDSVKKPKHYNSGKYEVIDMIESALSALPILPFQAYCLGNALKYICRAGLKGDFSEDIRKAITYLNWAIGVDLRNEETRNTDSR